MKKILGLMVGILLMGVNLYAGNGDLIVNGNLGVGVVTPEFKMDIAGNLRVTPGVVGNPVGVIGGSSAEQSIQLGTTTNSPLSFVTNGISRFTITNSGNVGVGTMNPGVALDVNGAIRSRIGIVQLNDGATTGGGLYFHKTVTGSGTNLSPYLFAETGNSLYFATNGNVTVPNMIINQNGKVGIGTTTPDPGYKLTVVGGGLTTEGIWQNSDIKLKKNILPVEGALDKILKLNGVSYEWKQGKDFEGETLEALKTDEDGKIKDDKYRNLPEGRTLGVIAQELENVLPEAVNTGEDEIKAVSYTKIIPVLIEAMKEQQKQITGQQKRIEELEKKVAQLK